MNTKKRLPDVESEESRVPVLPLVLIVVLLIGLVAILVYGFSQPQFRQSIKVLQVTPPATPDGLTVITEGDVTVYVPPNAIRLEGRITIAPAEPNLFQVAHDVWTRSKVAIVEFLDPERRAVPNVSFLQPIEVCFQISPEQWQEFNLQPDAYQVQYYAEDKNPSVWEALPLTTHPDQFQICGQASHLSVFGLATSLDIGIPLTGPTLTSTPIPTASQALGPIPTNERRKRDTPVPTKPPTQPPPTKFQPTPRPTQPPPTEPPPYP